jgi:hypothetical protein
MRRDTPLVIGERCQRLPGHLHAVGINKRKGRRPVELLQLRKGPRDGDVAVAGEDLDVAVWIVDPQSDLELSGLRAKFEVAKSGSLGMDVVTVMVSDSRVVGGW